MVKSKYTANNDYRAFCEQLEETDSVMVHHGVKGQRWGIRNYQNKDGSLTEAGRRHYGYGAKQNKKDNTEKQKNKDIDEKEKEMETRFQFNKKYTMRDALVKQCVNYTLDFEKERTHSLHQDEYENKAEAKAKMKKQLIANYALGAAAGAAYGTVAGVGTGSGVIGTAVGVASGSLVGTLASAEVISNYASKAIRASRANKQVEKQIKEIQANTNVDKKSGVKLKNKEMSMDDDMSYVNPGFNNWSDNTKNNCLLCSNAFALRRKGYDVMANGANDGYNQAVFLNFYPKAELTRVKIPNFINNQTKPQLMNALGIPDGGYGAISVEWAGNNGGHSMIYSVENGKPVLRDCQTNEAFRGNKLNRIFENTTKDVRIVRLDNVEPDLKAMINAGAINPGGQNFKPKQTEAEKAIESYKTPPAKMSKTNGKHGDTGIFDNLYKQSEFNYMVSKAAKEKKKMLKAVPNKEFDASEMGFENHFKLSNAAYTIEKEGSDKTLKAIYSTTTKSKSGKDIMVAIGANADNKEQNFKEFGSAAKQAAAILNQEASLYTQAKRGLINTKDEYSKEYFSKTDLQNMAKNMNINRVVVNNGTKHPLVIFEATAKDGTSTLVDCEFKTLPDGKVILVDTKTGRDYF